MKFKYHGKKVHTFYGEPVNKSCPFSRQCVSENRFSLRLSAPRYHAFTQHWALMTYLLLNCPNGKCQAVDPRGSLAGPCHWLLRPSFALFPHLPQVCGQLSFQTRTASQGYGTLDLHWGPPPPPAFPFPSLSPSPPPPALPFPSPSPPPSPLSVSELPPVGQR